MVDTVVISNKMKSPFLEFYRIFWSKTVFSGNIYRSNSTITHDIETEFDLYKISRSFDKYNLQRVWQIDRGRLLLRIPYVVPFMTCICSNQSFYFCRDLNFEHPSVVLLFISFNN